MITLTITVEDKEFAGLLADAIARGSLAGSGMATEAVSDAGPADPWADDYGPSGSLPNPGGMGQSVSPGMPTGPSPTNAGYAAATQMPPQSSAQTAPAAPSCAHGPRKFVPSGFSSKTGKPYPAFWGCQAPQGVQKCKGISA